MQYLQRSTKQEVLKDATIIHLFKRKGNHGGISLLSVAGKILARVLLNRLNEHLEWSGLLPESQCGFRKNRGTIDMIFTARQLQEKCQEQNVDLYMTFVDLSKAFDTVSREGLRKIMAKFGCPAKFIAKYIDRWCCQHYYTHAKLGRLPTACQKTEPLPYKLS